MSPKLGGLVCLGICGLAVSRADALGVGDLAPELRVAEWVSGTPIDLKRDFSKRIHLIEFWATWCPPCKESIPRLTRLQSKYRDQLAIVGVTAPDLRGNSPSAVRNFVKQLGPQMDYWIALDDREQTTNAYMVAARAMGIPHAFLVDKSGKIAWQGSPLDPSLEAIVDGLVGGTYDPKTEVKVAEMFGQLEKELAKENWAAVGKGLEDILNLSPAQEVALRAIRRVYIEEMAKPEEYRRWARAHIDRTKNRTRVMVLLAEVIMENENSFQIAPDLALEAARAAYEASQSRSSDTIALYASACYRIGALDQAISLQKEAVERSEPGERTQAQATFDFYNRCKKLQTSFFSS